MAWNGRHFLNLAELSCEDMIGLMKRASHFLDAGDRYEPNAPLDGKIIANLFMENSTRTRCSFTIATNRLGGDYIDLLGGTSSASKGESLVDTALNLEAMGVAAMVVQLHAREWSKSDVARNRWRSGNKCWLWYNCPPNASATRCCGVNAILWKRRSVRSTCCNRW